MYRTEFDGISFIEGTVEGAQIIEKIDVRLNNFLGQDQLKSLDDVKRKMANKVRAKKGNAVVNFTYGQRSTFFRSLFGLDDVHWYGAGMIARVPSPTEATIPPPLP